MIIVEPLPLTLESSDLLPESDYAAYAAATAYVVGAVVRYEHKIWRAIAGSQNVTPGTDPTKWLCLGATMAYRMLDNRSTSASLRAGPWSSVVKYTSVPDWCCLVGVNAASVEIEQKDVAGNVVKTATLDGFDYRCSDWWEYFYNDPTYQTFLAIPLIFVAGTLEVTFTGPALVGAAALVVGRSVSMGDTRWGLKASGRDYSTKDTNELGHTEFAPGAYVSRLELTTEVQTRQIPYVRRRLKDFRGKAVVLMAADGGTFESDATALLGLIGEHYVPFETPVVSPLYVDFEELI